MTWDARDSSRTKPPGARATRRRETRVARPDVMPVDDGGGQRLPTMPEAMGWDGWPGMDAPRRPTLEEERELRWAGQPTDKDLALWRRLLLRGSAPVDGGPYDTP